MLVPKIESTNVSTVANKFIDRQRLNAHINIHTEARPYICDQCGVSYKNNPNLRQHVRRVHLGQ